MDAQAAAELVEQLSTEPKKEGVDEVGLPVTTTNRTLYAKRSCNDCYGKGYIKRLNSKNVKAGEYDCHCVEKKYIRLRREIEKRLATALKDVPKEKQDEVRASALPSILEDLGFGGQK